MLVHTKEVLVVVLQADPVAVALGQRYRRDQVQLVKEIQVVVEQVEVVLAAAAVVAQAGLVGLALAEPAAAPGALVFNGQLDQVLIMPVAEAVGVQLAEQSA